MVNGIGFGSRTLDSDDITNLYCGANGMASGAYLALTDTTTAANYVVPAGKTLVIDQMIYNNTGSSNPEYSEFGYADDVTGTNFLSFTGTFRVMSTGTGGRYLLDCLLKIPAGKYPLIKSTSGNLNFYGIFRGVCA